MAEFVRSLAPEPRRRVRLALRGLAAGQGDVRTLQGDLQGYRRLRVAHYRIIYRETTEQGQRVIKCLFGAERNVVYEIFATLRLDDLSR